MDDVLGFFWLIGVSTILPLLSIWFSTRKKINETNKRQEILMAVLEKNPDMDVEQWLEKLSPKKKLLKEKLLTKLLWGIICLIAGIGVIGVSIYGAVNIIGGTDDPIVGIVLGGGIFAVGIALVASFFVGKKFLAKEIEAEEKQKIQE
ncbi:MAG: hypothetical protein MJY88_04590 [Bacteroidales bacterium]|nr:hypothetical protein [Bacteroidales bacterium]